MCCSSLTVTEACAHGTLPWEGPPGTCRHTAFCKRNAITLFRSLHLDGETILRITCTATDKYCPHAVAWAPVYYNSDDYEHLREGGLTEFQRELLLPPSAFGPRTAVWEVAQAERRELMELRERVAALEQEKQESKL